MMSAARKVVTGTRPRPGCGPLLRGWKGVWGQSFFPLAKPAEIYDPPNTGSRCCIRNIVGGSLSIRSNSDDPIEWTR